MKKFNLIFTLSACIIGATGFQSCNKDDNKEDPVPGQSKTITIDCSDYTQWQYFSFSTGLVTSAPADSVNDAIWKIRSDWDIAFHRQDVRTNSGLSGQANGGIQEASQTDFSAVTAALQSGYIQDTVIQIYLTGMSGPGAGSKYPVAGTVVTNGWAVLDMNSQTPWIIAKKVFIVKTADGKYAKIYLKNFLNDANKSGYVTMQYFYQADGSLNLNSN